jgi:hypothetical protein
MEELLNFFKENGVALQLTLDIGLNPTVHAFHKSEGVMNLHSTEGETLTEALEDMKRRLFS